MMPEKSRGARLNQIDDLAMAEEDITLEELTAAAIADGLQRTKQTPDPSQAKSRAETPEMPISFLEASEDL